MSDKEQRALKKALKPWLDTIEWCKKIAEDFGLVCEVRDPRAPHYQIFKLSGPGVCIIVYPYKCPSASGHLPRARDQNSKDKAQATIILAALGLHVRNRWNIESEAARLKSVKDQSDE